MAESRFAARSFGNHVSGSSKLEKMLDHQTVKTGGTAVHEIEVNFERTSPG